jgi:hypothetical protein
MFRRVLWYTSTDVLQERAASASEHRVIMKAANTSETSVNMYNTTRHSMPEDSHLRTRCCKNVKSHKKCYLMLMHVEQGQTLSFEM